MVIYVCLQKINFMKFFNTIILILISGSLLFNCKQDDHCTEENKGNITLGLYYIDDNDIIEYEIDQECPLSIHGMGEVSSYIYNDSSEITAITLPLSPYSDSVQFLFKIGEHADTLTINYNRHRLQTDLNCGVSYNYSLQSFKSTGRTIDSITTENNNVANDIENNCSIYLSCVVPELLQVAVDVYQFDSDSGMVVAFVNPTDLTNMVDTNDILLSEYSFVLYAFSDSAKFTIGSDDSKDSLTIYYQSDIRYYNNRCGYNYTYTIDSAVYTTHAIDTLITAY